MDRVIVRQIVSMAGPAGSFKPGSEHELEYGEALRLADAGIVAIAGAPVVVATPPGPTDPAPEPPEIESLRHALEDETPFEVLVEVAAAIPGDVEIPTDLRPVLRTIAHAAEALAELGERTSAPASETPPATAPEPLAEEPSAKPAGPQRTRKPGPKTETATTSPAETR